MNVFKLLSEIEKVDPEVYDRLDSRRRVFQHMGILGKTLAAAAVPGALSAIFTKAYAQTSAAPSVNDVLNFALKLEYLESYFYNAGLGARGANATPAQTALRAQFSATNLTALDKIRTDEANHVTFLRGALGTAAIADPTPAQFDFTGASRNGGVPRFADVFTNPATFLAVAQAFEDTGVRAYKGGAPLLMANDTVLEAALNIHSVEARHASRLRTMRRAGPGNNQASAVASNGTFTSSPKSWISGNDGGGPSPANTSAIYGPGMQPAYLPTSTGITFPGEENVTQGATNATNGVNLQTALASLNFPAAAFSEAFDEPLDVASVSNIARLFTTASSTLF
ncbi:hypothetical protein GCM10027048_31410 [Hymenobacter coalescens]